jgi:hypothetical protein
MAPVHWKGWMVAFAFLVAMLVGALVGGFFLLSRQWVTGAVVFVSFAFVAGAGFIGVAHRKGDHVRTVANYREDRQSAQH